MQRRQIFDMCGIDCPQSAPLLACNMQDVSGPLIHFRDPFQNILNAASGVNSPQRVAKYFNMFRSSFFIFRCAIFIEC